MTGRYIPNTEADRNEMLEAIGVASMEELLQSIPADLRMQSPLNLPSSMPEPDLVRGMKEMSRRNWDAGSRPCFLGAGAYHHYIPSAVGYLAAHSGFSTAYTPYQPEVSQGTLQAIFEFQTYVTLLTGLDVANASMYDGASAAAEAVLMAGRITKRNEVILPRCVHPEYRRVIGTYIRNTGMEVLETPFQKDGRTDYEAVKKSLSEKTAAVLIQSPNFFGCVENPECLSEALSSRGTLLIQSATEPLSLAVLPAPGKCGADIFAGEGQSFGNPLSFGGPYLGLLATRTNFTRNLPGRLVGETVDKKGERGFVLTLATREQHIRRERATSNICSNQSLCALRASMYLSMLGKRGIRDLALMNMKKTAHALKLITSLKGYHALFSASAFNEFAVATPAPAEEIQRALEGEGMIGGLNLSVQYPELGEVMLFCVTEMIRKRDIERLAGVLSRF